MQVKTTTHSENEVTLSVVPNSDELKAIKEHVLKHFQSHAKLPGFREGKAPLAMVEKSVDQARLQSEFLEEALNQLYPQAVRSENLRPVGQPEVTVKKFVPFTTLEFDAKITVVGEVKLPDYTKIRKPRTEVKITAEDVQGVLKSLALRLAEKNDVERAAKKGDEIWIDFKGTDSKGQPVNGADGKDYPLVLGSNTFIPGFEDNLIGLKAGEEKTFTLTFPKDYGVKALANRKVTFEAKVTKVQEVVSPKIDDEFASKAGPFKTLKDLKDDIKKQLKVERQREADLDYESELVREISDKSKVTVPKPMIDSQVEHMLQDLRQNLTYRGQTYDEYLESEGMTDEKYRKEVVAPEAEARVKAGLVLSEVADKEKIDVTPEELEIRMQVLKAQYKDPTMQAELDKPETRRDIASRMLSEKTVAKLASYATQK